MRLSLKYALPILLPPVILLCTTTCSKSLETCTGNCGGIDFTGFVFDKTNNQPLANQTITVTLYQKRPCLPCASYTLVSGQSTNTGSFLLSASFDTTLMKNHYLGISASCPPNYITHPTPVGPGILPEKSPQLSIQSFDLDPLVLNNLSFGFYPGALLTINLHRTTDIVTREPQLSLVFALDGNNLSGWGLEQSASNKDTSLTINTSAAVFTKITSSKFTAPATMTAHTDSVKCQAEANNKIDIYY